MARAKSGRKNISIPQSVREVGEELVVILHKGSFSQLLTDLILDARKRHASGADRSPEQYLNEIVELLAKNRALEAKLKAKEEIFKRERKGLVGALALAEADLKEARAAT
jgi:hypothetical protein